MGRAIASLLRPPCHFSFQRLSDTSSILRWLLHPRHEERPLNRAAPFRFAFLSAFSVPRSKHPRPSDARSPFHNPLRASARCGLLPHSESGSPSADSVQSPSVALHYKLKSLVACFQQFIAF
jgi:hypothetical protein